VAKDKDTESQAAGETAGRTEGAGGQQPAAQPGQQATITIDDSTVQAHYANFCRVSSTPEELVLDLGLNPQPYATGPQTIRVSQRIILNHYTAKRLLSALSMALQRHEQAFGVLETDIRKRVRNT
jgi:hypothetical protein